jgi:predicted patatin/cPLA2 family phospholipase
MEKKKDIIVFQGGGQYFFWNMGIVAYLNKHFDMEDIKLVGASAGALTAVLMVCKIDAEKALECALRICDEHKVRERWLMFVGIWGEIVKEWLEELLPENAADLCSDKVYILISSLLGKHVVSSFRSKQDLIECLLASTHIPFLMDYLPFRWWKGWWCYDGCIGNFTNDPYMIFDKKKHQYHFFHFQHDKEQKYSIFNFFPKNTKDVAKFIEHGFLHAKNQHQQNNLSLQEKK